MHKFTVDVDKCISCGQCVNDCLFSVLEMKDDHPDFARPENCIGCLHCFTICPVGAITFDSHDPGKAPALEPIPSAKSFEAFIRQRRSIRSYKQENINPATMRNMLEMAWSAPSGVNQHLLRITAIDDMAKMEEFRKKVYAYLDKMVSSGKFQNEYMLKYLGSDHGMWLKEDKILRGAPHMVVASYASGAATGQQDTIIYLSYLEMLAWTMGFGTLWCGFMYLLLKTLPDLVKLLGVPDNYEIGYPMLLGLPSVHYARGVERGGANISIWRG